MKWLRRRRVDEIWRGVYRDFDEVPTRGPGHDSAEWTSALGEALSTARTAPPHEALILEHEALLMTLRFLEDCRHVVDFGGGAGETYVYLNRVEPDLRLRYDVIELPPVVAAAGPLLPEVQFAESAGPQHRGADVLFVKSALQYVRDYAGTLRALFALNPRVLILEKFSGVNGYSYATAQVNVADSSIPYWFISFEEVFSIAAGAGYERRLWRRLPRTYDQSAFPPERRMGQASTIIFGRAERR